MRNIGNVKKFQTGFTLMELVVVITIIAFLSSAVLFSVTQYINKGKDSNIQGMLVTLIPAGESYYNIENLQYGDGYGGISGPGFCESTIVTNVVSQISLRDPLEICTDAEQPGLCCHVSGDGSAWAACAQLFTDPNLAFCVDSRGIKKEISKDDCVRNIDFCPD